MTLLGENAGKRRFICSFVKLVDGKLTPNVVVIAAPNNIVAKARLCEKYRVKNIDIPRSRHQANDMEGIKSIRPSETNYYEGETSDENFISNDPQS